MKRTGINRRIDELGRIVVPMEMRKALNISSGEELEIYTENNTIVLRKTDSFCLLCGKTEELVDFNGQKICRNCVKQIKKI